MVQNSGITPEFGPSQRIAAVFIDADNLTDKTIEKNEKKKTVKNS